MAAEACVSRWPVVRTWWSPIGHSMYVIHNGLPDVDFTIVDGTVYAKNQSTVPSILEPGQAYVLKAIIGKTYSFTIENIYFHQLENGIYVKMPTISFNEDTKCFPYKLLEDVKCENVVKITFNMILPSGRQFSLTDTLDGCFNVLMHLELPFARIWKKYADLDMNTKFKMLIDCLILCNLKATFTLTMKNFSMVRILT